jgi:hypothetical protein
MKEIYNNDASLSIHLKKILVVGTGEMNFKATKYILPSTSTVGELRLSPRAGYMLCSNGLSPAQLPWSI